MAIAFRDSANAVSSTATTSITINKPATAATGDLLIAFVELVSQSSAYPLALSGWTPLYTDDLVQLVYYRFVQAGDPSSWTLTAATSSVYVTATVAYSGVDSSIPFYSQQGKRQSASTTVTTATLNNVDSSAWVVTAAMDQQSASAIQSATSANYTERQDIDTTATGNRHIAVYDSNGAVATGNVSDTITLQNTPSFTGSWIGLLRPSGGVSDTPIRYRDFKYDSNAWTAAAGGTTSVTLTAPPGAVNGDLMLCVMAINTNATITDPTGWTVESSQSFSTTWKMKVYSRFFVTGDTTWSVTLSAASRYAYNIVAYKGVDSGTPYIGTPTTATATVGTETSLAPAAITNTSTDAWCVVLGSSGMSASRPGMVVTPTNFVVTNQQGAETAQTNATHFTNTGFVDSGGKIAAASTSASVAMGNLSTTGLTALAYNEGGGTWFAILNPAATGTSASAGLAAVTATALAPSITDATSPGAGLAAVTATALAPVIAIGVNADVATVVGAAGDATATLAAAPSPGAAAATATAIGPVPALTLSPGAGAAQVSAAANGASVAIGVPAGAAAATAAAQDASPALTLSPGTGLATVTASALAPSITDATSPGAGLAAATGTAYPATVSTSSAVSAPAGLAAATAAAQDATPALTLSPVAGAAGATASAYGAMVDLVLSPSAGTAATTAAAYGATVAIGVQATAGVATVVAAALGVSASLTLSVSPGRASVLAAALQPTASVTTSVPPIERTFIVPRESRVDIVQHEVRRAVVGPESRRA